jgi:hypothetical protein
MNDFKKDVAEFLGRKQKPSTRKKIAKAMTGKKNPAYKDGRRSYRRIAGAKKGEHVDHKDGNSKNNSPSNLKKFKAKGKPRSDHEKKHDRSKNFKSSGGRKKVTRGYKAKRLKRKAK